MTGRSFHASGLLLLLSLLASAATVLEAAPSRRLQSIGVCPALPRGANNTAPTAPSYKWGTYAVFGPEYASLPLGYPAGDFGTLDVEVQSAEFLASREDAVFQGVRASLALEFACSAGNCLTSLASFVRLYAAIQAPRMANFTMGPHSDAAFARLRLTVAPMLIKRVASYDKLPIRERDIKGLAGIIASTGMSLRQLVAVRRVFAVDFTPFAGVLAPSPGGVLELPVGLFFVAGRGRGERLMPLAIKFTVTNGNVYSPADTPADWLLAKAAFNALDTSVHAGLHVVLDHLILENLCISARRNLADDHPLYPLIAIPCKYNAGIIKEGIENLLPNATGTFDKFLAVSGPSLVRALPKLVAQYNWERAFLAADLFSRGVADIPGFAYASDAGAAYSALLEYATSVLGNFYGGGRLASATAIARDRQLQGFLRDLGPGGQGAIPGFPAARSVSTLATLAKIAAQTMWIAGVQHHALNSDAVGLYELVMPAGPSKLFAPPPAQKGELTEGALLRRILLPRVVPMPDGRTEDGWFWFLQAVQRGMFFRIQPALKREDQLLHAYTTAWQPPPGCAVGPALARAADVLHTRLRGLSTSIQAREAALAGVLPQFTLLDPAKLPYYSYV